MIATNPPRSLVPARQVTVPPEPMDQPAPAVVLLQFAAGTIMRSGKSIIVGAPAPPESTTCFAVPAAVARGTLPAPNPYPIPPAGQIAEEAMTLVLVNPATPPLTALVG